MARPTKGRSDAPRGSLEIAQEQDRGGNRSHQFAEVNEEVDDGVLVFADGVGGAVVAEEADEVADDKQFADADGEDFHFSFLPFI